MIIFWILIYLLIAGASIFGLIVFADKANCLKDSLGYLFCVPYVISGLLWPICLIPVSAYIAAKWYIANRKD